VIEVRVGELAETRAGAVLRPVAADWSAATAASRRVELQAGAVVSRPLDPGELPIGSALITPAGDLPAQFLVHVVVRSLDEPVTASGIRRALQNGLRRLVEWGIESVALPPLGTGAGNLDAEESASVVIPVLLEHIAEHPHPGTVIIVAENEYERQAFEAALARSAEQASGLDEDVFFRP
jgi:O-acetyl-ADP-ribose deacetylase (regulator of RNase III)